MRVAVTGATGLIGRALVKALLREGRQVTRLVRRAGDDVPGAASVLWDPEAGVIDAAALENHRAVIHLAGENISEGRWTEEKKRRIRDSRVRGTELIANTISGLRSPPRSFLSASAVGIYGDRGGEELTEDSAPGDDFLAGVCREWEGATRAAEAANIRVAHLRFGVVLSPDGGALAKLVPPFKLGLGGKLGSGEQFMSWIALDDAVRAILFILERDELRGPINVVAPEPVTNKELTATLGDILARPTIFTVPAFGARLAFGEMADGVLLASARVLPKRLRAVDFVFAHPRLKPALGFLLGKK